MIKSFAQDIAKIEVGKDWPYSFVRRNSDELGCTWFDGFDIARKRADNASRYRAYYELIGEKIEKYNILPCNTYNVDEKSFPRRHQSYQERWQQIMDHVPGMWQVQDSWLTEFDPEHQAAFFTTSETGWTNHELGKEWLIGVFDRFTKEKARNGRDYRLLITDGHSSHVNMDFLECPLMCPFGPLSTAYTNQLIQWTAKTQGLIRLSKREFWSLFWNAFGSSFSAENIASGWKRTGLLPFDPEVVLSQITEKIEDESESGDGSVDSLALQQPTARDLRRLVDKNELLRYENQGLRETIFHEKQRRMRALQKWPKRA
ncbi:DDE superfamily endonuclease [Hirsutella rhossiliensis]